MPSFAEQVSSFKKHENIRTKQKLRFNAILAKTQKQQEKRFNSLKKKVVLYLQLVYGKEFIARPSYYDNNYKKLSVYHAERLLLKNNNFTPEFLKTCHQNMIANIKLKDKQPTPKHVSVPVKIFEMSDAEITDMVAKKYFMKTIAGHVPKKMLLF